MAMSADLSKVCGGLIRRMAVRAPGAQIRTSTALVHSQDITRVRGLCHIGYQSDKYSSIEPGCKSHLCHFLAGDLNKYLQH